MNQQANINEYKVFKTDVKKMTDAELEASLRELREMTMIQKPAHPQPAFRQRAA